MNIIDLPASSYMMLRMPLEKLGVILVGFGGLVPTS